MTTKDRPLRISAKSTPESRIRRHPSQATRDVDHLGKQASTAAVQRKWQKPGIRCRIDDIQHRA